jgi:hypothetical protein
MDKLLYIAETNACGDVECVWIKPPGQLTARIFEAGNYRFDPRVPAEFHGASPSAIGAWLSSRELGRAHPKG